MGFFATLAAKLTLDGSHFKAGIREAEHQAKHFGKDVLGELKGQLAAAFGAAAVVEFGRKVIEHVKQIHDASEQYKISTTEVQRWGAAAAKSGQDIGFVGARLDKLNELRKKAAEHPMSAEADLWRRLGLTIDQANDSEKETIDLARDIRTEGKGIENDFFEAFGRGGRKMISIIEEIKKAKDEGWMLSNEETEQYVKNIHAMELAWLKLKSRAAKVGADTMEHPVKEFFKNAFTFAIPMWYKLLGGGEKKSNPYDMGADLGVGHSDASSAPLYENKDLADQRKSTAATERALAEKLLEVEFKRVGAGQQLNILAQRRAEWNEKAAAAERALGQVEDEQLREELKEDVAFARTKAADTQEQINALEKKGEAHRLSADSAMRSGQLVGNAPAALAYFTSYGRKADEQLHVAKASNLQLIEANKKLEKMVGKEKRFWAEFEP